MENFRSGSAPGCRPKLGEFCPQMFLGSYVLIALGGSLGTEMVVIPVLTGVPAILGEKGTESGLTKPGQQPGSSLGGGKKPRVVGGSPC